MLMDLEASTMWTLTTIGMKTMAALASDWSMRRRPHHHQNFQNVRKYAAGQSFGLYQCQFLFIVMGRPYPEKCNSGSCGTTCELNAVAGQSDEQLPLVLLLLCSHRYLRTSTSLRAVLSLVWSLSWPVEAEYHKILRPQESVAPSLCHPGRYLVRFNLPQLASALAGESNPSLQLEEEGLQVDHPIS